jgi:hypothetical protein
MKAKNQFKIERWIGLLLIFITTATKASETETNWEWLTFRLVIPQTNLVIGDKMPASIVVSNILDQEHFLRFSTQNRCDCGYGYFSIIESATGNKIECKFKPNGDFTMNRNFYLPGHKSHTADFDLNAVFFMTNRGSYSVSAIGWFPVSEPPTNNQFSTIAAPPISIQLSTGTKTNAPPK